MSRYNDNPLDRDPLSNTTYKRILTICICFMLFHFTIYQSITVSAVENTLDISDNNSVNEENDEGYNSNDYGVFHAFYPSYALYSEQTEKYIDEVDSLSFAWSRIDAEVPGTLNINVGKKGNYSFYYPKDYLLPVRYAKSKGKSIQLNIYAGGNDCTKLLPYEDKRTDIINGIINTMQKDITQGEGLYYDGVVIDFEGLRNTNNNKSSLLYEGEQISTHFSTFLTELKLQLDPLGKKLYVAVNPRKFYDGYDYKEIINVADRVILMAHDYEPTERLRKDQVQQYTGFNSYEPIYSLAPINLIRQALDDIHSSADDASELSKVWLQISFDSAQWRYDVNGIEGWEALDASALSKEGRLAPLYKTIKARIDNSDGSGQNITYGYNNELQSPYIQYYNSKDKSFNVILYEDSNSIDAKIDLAITYGLGGISIWSLWNVPDYNDTKGKEFHLDVWSRIVSKMNSPYIQPADSTKYIKFTDAIVEQTIREKLGKFSGNISVADLKGIYRLKLREGVKSLNDIKHLVNLEYLDARQLNLKDIKALGKLTNLRVLYLQKNQISDISALKKLKYLEVLSLNSNQITNVRPLSTLTKLQELYLSENKITDIQPLAKLANLNKLYIKENKLSSIAPLSGLKNLKVLALDKNQVSDLKPLAKLTNLRELYLSENKITSINSLKGLINLKILSLNRNSISKLEPLAKLTALEKLYMKDNKIANIDSLKELKNLQELYLAGNKISDYSQIKESYSKTNFSCDFLVVQNQLKRKL